MIGFIIALVLSLGILAGTYLYLQKGMSETVGTEKEDLEKALHALDDELQNLTKYISSYASKGQFATLAAMVEKAGKELSDEKSSLKSIESKLDQAQKDVETKEFQQQEIKSAREEDEEKLAELLAQYSDLSNQSIDLEQKLAQSLKYLDTMMEEMQFSSDQRTALEQLSETLTNAGSLLRELITEYNSVNERLTMLKEQHDDLEDEYTRLVEQQLGE